MIHSVTIENYKSIAKVQLDLGRVNIFIGENGSGKSNILEAIALAGAACADKLDNEFLSSRGVRVTDPQLMRPAFDGFKPDESVKISITDPLHPKLTYVLRNDNAPYSNWEMNIETDGNIEGVFKFEDFKVALEELVKTPNRGNVKISEVLESLRVAVTSALDEKLSNPKAKKEKSRKGEKKKVTVPLSLDVDSIFSQILLKKSAPFIAHRDVLSQYLVYSPENSSLRLFEREGQIEPLGINGEGLLKLLSVMSEKSDQRALTGVKKCLHLLGWFEDFKLVRGTRNPAARISITDTFLSSKRNQFDQRSANEGFLFLLFYFTLFSSDLTPSFFAIDNIDASLNPKLCERLIIELVGLAKENGKQVLLTTHNPAILDGLNLDDEDQRLFIVSRGREGHTRVRRFKKPAESGGDEPPKLRLSEAFLRGSLGGLPKTF
ncbi:AAA family ATPase [Mesorhizobium sp. B2-3-12]|uniref:AAA family ATPase n=1 Tax=Mesorhizobium sp. B2-3-12 TaxID=2589952 RepID=UPI00112EE323|nr:AAA family ATPase [Mesorhizobium sp. B2-3-12]TPL82360.1 chromosome segregation protein SMC [Mesorhizobium sp. B2-3-12]